MTLGSGGLTISGLSAEVVVEHFELTDTVRIQGLGGNDVFDLTAIGAGGPFIFAEGGAGDDVYKISSSFPSLSKASMRASTRSRAPSPTRSAPISRT